MKTMLKTKLDNVRASIYDFDVHRVARFVYNAEIQKYHTFVQAYGLKKFAVMDLKQKLNLKKKEYIDRLRVVFDSIVAENPLNLYSDESFFEHINIENKLRSLKIIRKNDIVGYFMLKAFHDKIKDSEIFNRLIVIDSDIKKLEQIIGSYNDYYKELKIANPNIPGNPKAKITKQDIDFLDKGLISPNVKAVMYFYLNNIKILRNNSEFCSDDMDDEVLEKCFADNFKSSLAGLQKRSEVLQDQIVRKYL